MNLADGASIKDNKKDDYMNQVLQLMDRFSDSDMTKLQVRSRRIQSFFASVNERNDRGSSCRTIKNSRYGAD